MLKLLAVSCLLACSIAFAHVRINVVAASSRLPFLINPQDLVSSQYIKVTGEETKPWMVGLLIFL